MKEGGEIFREVTIKIYLLHPSWGGGEEKEKEKEKEKERVKEKQLGDHRLLYSGHLSSFSFHSSSERTKVSLPLLSPRPTPPPTSLPLTLFFSSLSSKQIKKQLSAYKPYDPQKEKEKERERERKQQQEGEKERKRIGLLKKKMGFKPKYPVLMVPGLGSTALEVWEGKSEWFR